ncbi:MAG: hypothetical protein AB1Z23_11865 [Eubacteriales bacterium]
MIREKKTKKEVSGNRAFLVVILLSFVIIIMSSFVGYLENNFGIKHLEKIIYIAIVVIAYFLIKNYLTEYRYSFFDNELIVEKILGKKITSVATIKSKEIEYFGKASDTFINKKEIEIINCYVYKKNAYAIKFTQDDITKAILINPSEDLILQIKKSLEAKDFDEVEEEKLIK